MTASLLDGKHVASLRLDALKTQVDARLKQGFPAPGLAVILLGDDPASQIYVNHKRKACQRVGINTYAYDLPADTGESNLIELIDNLNESPEVHGILVQLPLPLHIHARAIIERINPKKDVDGFHPYNLGRLAQGDPTLRPCTPYGIINLLTHYDISPLGKRAVIIGSSNIVGRPMALELLLARATVTVCNRATQHLESHVREAELIIIAAGSKDILDPSWFNKNQIVIDVGMHREDNGKLRGDLDFESVKNKVAWITPVPGGVGPMTICTLLENTFRAAVA